MGSLLDERLYKQEKEDFVLNNHGTSRADVIITLLPNITSTILCSVVVGVFGNNGASRSNKLFLEFAFFAIPCILSCTILADHALGLSFSALILAISIYLFTVKSPITLKPAVKQATKTRHAFITNFRALTNLITVVCILAVDFRAFPRRLAKTEVFGYSLMDTGVGLFILSNALVAPESRNVNYNERLSFVQALNSNVKSCVKSCIPLLLLGFGRFLSVEYLQYQRHVTEYGVHWNFFVTLAFVKIFTSLFSCFTSPRYSAVTGMTVLVVQEFALNVWGFKEWVLGAAPRDSFVSANREGLISIPGYVGLYMLSVAMGRMIHSVYNSRKTRNFTIFKFSREDKGFHVTKSLNVCAYLATVALNGYLITFLIDEHLGVSRRLANFGYCIWIVTLSSTMIGLLVVVDILVDLGNEFKLQLNSKAKVDDSVDIEFMSNSLEIYEAVNYNGLSFFLFANVLTGAVNMHVKTLYVDDLSAVAIITLYMAANIAFVAILRRFKVQVKL